MYYITIVHVIYYFSIDITGKDTKQDHQDKVNRSNYLFTEVWSIISCTGGSNVS